MPVWANIFLGRELLRGPKALNILDKRRMASDGREMLSRLSRNMPADRRADLAALWRAAAGDRHCAGGGLGLERDHHG